MRIHICATVHLANCLSVYLSFFSLICCLPLSTTFDSSLRFLLEFLSKMEPLLIEILRIGWISTLNSKLFGPDVLEKEKPSVFNSNERLD